MRIHRLTPLMLTTLTLAISACDVDGLEDRDGLFAEEDLDQAEQDEPSAEFGGASDVVAEPDAQLAATWTGWYDRDDPSGNGDYESAWDQTGVCSQPTAVECRTTSGLALWQTGENVTCSTGQVRCVHAEQPDGYCDYDYKVRFLCPSGGGGGGGGGDGGGGGGGCLLEPCPIEL